ncbi:MAG: hypothetical protein ACPHUF_16490, partial [Gammaproteobacteria bacterium]
RLVFSGNHSALRVGTECGETVKASTSFDENVEEFCSFGADSGYRLRSDLALAQHRDHLH